MENGLLGADISLMILLGKTFESAFVMRWPLLPREPLALHYAEYLT